MIGHSTISSHLSRIGLAGVLGALGACSDTTDEVPVRIEAEGIEAVVVMARNATVELVGERDRDEIRVLATQRFSRHRPDVSVERVDEELRVSHECPAQELCEVHYNIVMPRDIDAVVESEGGSVLVTQLVGDVSVSTTSGDVFGSALRSTEVDVSSDDGEVTLAFEAAPERVTVNTREGDVTISVPRDQEYRIELDTDEGDVSLVDLSSTPEGERSIDVRSEDGDITVQGTRPVDDVV